ncbi:uncharacterized protein [Narcine bancroftii]|uniref:uncharacterized protein n=1 Tax=Narcine bancroftii TaxID=1343680 RepID=UPI0038313A4B
MLTGYFVLPIYTQLTYSPWYAPNGGKKLEPQEKIHADTRRIYSLQTVWDSNTSPDRWLCYSFALTTILTIPLIVEKEEKHDILWITNICTTRQEATKPCSLREVKWCEQDVARTSGTEFKGKVKQWFVVIGVWDSLSTLAQGTNYCQTSVGGHTFLMLSLHTLLWLAEHTGYSFCPLLFELYEQAIIKPVASIEAILKKIIHQHDVR